MNRRAFIRGGLVAAGGAGVALVGERAPALWAPHRLPIDGGYAPTEDHGSMITHGQVQTTFFVPTTDPVVALTFDDGPEPDWTPMVLDQLDEVNAPATFFMIGEHLQANAHLVAGRMDRHEIGNHTWTHMDLAQHDVNSILAEVTRSHKLIESTFGRPPTIIRPPWGHMGGAALLAASYMGYGIVLWSEEMHPDQYLTDTKAQVADIVTKARPGAIILAHDVGDPHRLGGLKGVADIVRGLRAKGLEPITVSDMMARATTPRQTV